MRLCSLSMPSSSGLGEVASMWVRQSWPNSKRKGVALPGSRGSGFARCSQKVGCTYSSHRRSQLLQSSTRVSWIHPSQPLYSFLSPRVVGMVIVGVTLSHLQRCWTTSVVNSVPGSLQRDRGILNVNSNSRSFLATFSRSCWVVDRRIGICWLCPL